MITDKSQFPKFEDCFMPILRTYKKYGSLTRHELRQKVYQDFYPDYSLEPLAGKSKSPLIFSRIHWGNYYLYAGKFVEKVQRGKYKLSKKGDDYLNSGDTLTYKYLKTKDDDFMNSSFHNGQKGDDNNGNNDNTEKMTPQDMFELGYQQLEEPKKEDLLEKLMDIDPFVFEKVVGTLCESMGYGTFIETPKSRDGGIDGIIKGDSLGFEKIYIQAKRYKDGNLVQGKEMQNFVGALTLASAKKGIFFTTSSFASNAEKTAEKASTNGQEIILIDGKMLIDLMFKYNVGVQTKEVYEIKEIDEDFFLNFN